VPPPSPSSGTFLSLAEADSRDVLVDQIVHNWQRADLRPYETADALVRLKSEFGMTPAEIAKLTGKSIGEVAKLIALVERLFPKFKSGYASSAKPR